MQLAKEYNPVRSMDYILKRLAENARTKKTEIAVNLPIVREYAEELLTPEEQKLCDMATD